MAYNREFRFSRTRRVEVDFERTLDDLILVGAWAYAARPDYRPIILTHSVTAPRAIRELLPWLCREDQALAVDIACSLSDQIRALYRAPMPALAEQQRSAAVLIDQACISGDDHAIKLTEACLDQHKRQPAAVYLAVSDDISRRLALQV
jgi:hypothetical protein